MAVSFTLLLDYTLPTFLVDDQKHWALGGSIGHLEEVISDPSQSIASTVTQCANKMAKLVYAMCARYLSNGNKMNSVVLEGNL